MARGDCFLLTAGQPYVLATDLSLPTTRAETVYVGGCDRVGIHNGGGDVFLVGARFSFSGRHADGLLGSLPSVVFAKKGSDQASVLRWSLDLYGKEIRDRNPGGSLIAEHLAHIMLIQVLRLHRTSSGRTGVGLLFAHTDPQLSAAVAAMHADVRRSWALEELGRAAGMSRSSFASRFKRVAGISPMEYLACWRIHTAADRLRSTSHSIGRVASSVGYKSEAAFSRAFKRAMGQSPKHHRRLVEPSTDCQSLAKAAVTAPFSRVLSVAAALATTSKAPSDLYPKATAELD